MCGDELPVNPAAVRLGAISRSTDAATGGGGGGGGV